MPRQKSALTSTSYVGRRLAARAGLRNDSIPPGIPATGQHRIVRPPAEPPPPAEPVGSPARRVALVAFVVAAVIALLGLGVYLGGVL